MTGDVVRVCEVCSKEGIEYKEIIEHHRSYSPEVVVWVCWRCHRLVHHRHLRAFTNEQLVKLLSEVELRRQNEQLGDLKLDGRKREERRKKKDRHRPKYSNPPCERWITDPLLIATEI